MTFRTIVKAVLPERLRGCVDRKRLERLRARNRQRSAQEVFAEIYRSNEWSSGASGFDSGHGSTDALSAPYVTAVRAFIAEHGITSVVDLGCGDFRVGAALCEGGLSYVGIDVVPELVAHNQNVFGSTSISFCCRDIAADELPSAELCLVRQVFQHLSNAEILATVAKFNQYRFVLVTEHYPSEQRMGAPNLDKPHGGDTRVLDNSAVMLDYPPFRLTVQPFCSVAANPWLVSPDETIRTVLWCNSGASTVFSP